MTKSVVLFEVQGNFASGKTMLINHVKRIINDRSEEETEFHFIKEPQLNDIFESAFTLRRSAAAYVSALISHYYFELTNVLNYIVCKYQADGRLVKNHVIIMEKGLSACINVYIPMMRCHRLLEARDCGLLTQIAQSHEKALKSMIEFRTVYFFLVTDWVDACINLIYNIYRKASISEKETRKCEQLLESWCFQLDDNSIQGSQNSILRFMFEKIPDLKYPLSNAELISELELNPNSTWGKRKKT